MLCWWQRRVNLKEWVTDVLCELVILVVVKSSKSLKENLSLMFIFEAFNLLLQKRIPFQRLVCRRTLWIKSEVLQEVESCRGLTLDFSAGKQRNWLTWLKSSWCHRIVKGFVLGSNHVPHLEHFVEESEVVLGCWYGMRKSNVLSTC